MKLVSLVIAILLSFGIAAATDLQLMHTKPVCAHPDKTAAWCTYEDSKPSAANAGMNDAIRAQLDAVTDPATDRIYVAYFSFSNWSVFGKLCEKAKAGIPIDFFLDSAYRGKDINLQLENGTCTKEEKATYDAAIAAGQSWPKLKNVRFHYLGQMSESPFIWRLHHNKFMIIDAAVSDTVKINFSSGNLSSFGTSLHFDHWVTATVPRASNMYGTHQCVIQAMKKAIDPDGDGVDSQIDDPNLYRKTLDNCLKKMNSLSVADAVSAEKIAPLFAPNPANEIAKTLVKEIDKVKSGTITGAIQHFLHNDIAKALRKACERGVPVQMLMDDDVISGESEVPGVGSFFDQMLDGNCMQFRFMQTNAEAFQLMHNKFLILGDKRVFAGAGHFTYSAMRDNYENFYLLEDTVVHGQYQNLFKYMWDMSISKDQVVIPPPQPEEEEIPEA